MKSLAIFRLTFFILLLAISLTNYYWHRYSGWWLPKGLYKERVVVVGRIASLPQQNVLGTSFLFKLEKINGEKVGSLIRLTGYIARQKGLQNSLLAGDRWQFIARLKPVHALHNFEGFDYERHLILQGVRATGYLVTNAEQHCLLHDPSYYPLLHLRQTIQRNIESSLTQFPEEAAIISAVTVGSITSMTTEQWRVFQLTGTGHLLSISSLPVYLLALLGFIAFKSLGKIFPRLYLRVPAPYLAAMGAFVFAFIYSALAGFSWPTQRSLIMVLAFSLSEILHRRMPLWRRLVFAAILILVVEPEAVFSASFILSFAAVVCLCYGLGGRWQLYRTLHQTWRMQWAIFLGLLPLSLFYFKQISLVMLVANFVAIPAVTWLVIPLGLSATLSFLVSAKLAHYLLVMAAYVLKFLWIFLEYLSHWSYAAWHHVLASPWLLMAVSLGAVLILAPRGLPGRFLGLIAFGLLLFSQVKKPGNGEWWLTVLDVGQGLALVVQTKNHVMIYDAGVRYPGAFDAGRDVVLPFLEARHLQEPDLLVISHGDNDHSGGAEALVSALNIKQILSSIPAKFKPWMVHPCMAGQAWRWDGVDFKVLSPEPGASYQGNNSSCVIKVGTPRGSALLTGDIQRPAEHYLLQHWLGELNARVLIVPHHGSLSSSIEAFVQAVGAKTVIFATGFLNRYRFPHPKIVSLYQKYHAKMLSSARDGAIQLRFMSNGQLLVTTAIKHEKHTEL